MVVRVKVGVVVSVRVRGFVKLWDKTYECTCDHDMSALETSFNCRLCVCVWLCACGCVCVCVCDRGRGRVREVVRVKVRVVVSVRMRVGVWVS